MTIELSEPMFPCPLPGIFHHNRQHTQWTQFLWGKNWTNVTLSVVSAKASCSAWNIRLLDSLLDSEIEFEAIVSLMGRELVPGARVFQNFAFVLGKVELSRLSRRMAIVESVDVANEIVDMDYNSNIHDHSGQIPRQFNSPMSRDFPSSWTSFRV